MPSVLTELLRIALAIVPFVALLLLSFRINLSKQKRSRQCMLPLAALAYCIAVVLLTDRINGWIIAVIAMMGQDIPFIEKLNLPKWINYIFNAVIILGFLIVKGTLLPLVNMIWNKARFLFNQTSGKLYEYNDRMNVWVLKNEFAQAKSLWKSFYWFGVGVSSVVLALSQLYSESIFFSAPFYPVFGILVMGEILFFLSGLTYQEMLSTIAGEDDEYYRIANYGMLRRIFHDLFDNRILLDNTADNLSGISSFEMLDNLAESKNKLDVVISKYFTDLKEKGHCIDTGFVRASIDMVNGKSVLINIPFYHDLTGYILLPLVRRLLSYEKALVIVGRDSAADDVTNWIHNGIAAFCGTPELWKTGILTEQKTECDVAVLRFADVYNRRVLDANALFLNQVDFVLLIEPSRIVSTGQIGLSLIVDQLGKGSKEIVYCSCDRNCNGLVDTLSHILKVNLTEVYATNPTPAICSFMYWNAHGDFLHHRILPGIAHYLGVGTELSSVALRNQIANSVWVSSERFPVLDMRWIAGQYYKIICNYIGYPQSQEAFAEVFKVDSNLWNLDVKDNAFLTVEDEFNNLFEMTRLYATRSKNQGFVNVISENYLLRDYMLDNASVFTADSKVIPSIVSDYTRTERNTVLGLIMRMYGGEVSDNDLKHTLSLAGINCADAYDKFRELVPKHCLLDTVDIVTLFRDEISGDEMRMEKLPYYTINDTNTQLAAYARTLSNAYFIIEDDKDKNYYIGAMLFGQVFQKYLPGQFLTYSGKYYQVQTITRESGVVLRRAADHITDRKSYRQRRKYSLSGFQPDSAMGSRRTGRGIELYSGFCDICVKTLGYYELSSLDNVAAAHPVDLNNIPDRVYRHKSVLCLKLPGSSEDVRFTITLLLNEIFITLYPESYHYITATIQKCSNTASNITALINPVTLHGFEDKESIYIIEDCEIDLGLLVSVERNLTWLFEIIADWLAWQEQKLAGTELPASIAEQAAASEYPPQDTAESAVADNNMAEETYFETEDTLDTGNGDAVEEAPVTDNAPETGDGNTVEEAEAVLADNAENSEADDILADDTENSETEDMLATDAENGEADDMLETNVEDIGTDERLETGDGAAASEIYDMPADESVISDHITGFPTAPPKKYSEGHYILYGYERLDPMLNIQGTVRFLSQHCYDKNALEQARVNSDVAAKTESETNFDKPDAHFCDFCAVELSGGEYDVLADGRERCIQCAKSPLKTVEQFTRLYENALRNMETFFGIRINVPIKVCMADAKKIAKLCGLQFVPSPRYTGRVLAFAKKDSGGFTIYVENGSPKIAAVANIVHELTHIWQYVNWNRKNIIKKYGKDNELLVYEGMAKWAEIQYLYFLNEVSYAKRQEIYTRIRDDEYGQGFIKYDERYPLVCGPGYRKTSPFNKEWPLELPI